MSPRTSEAFAPAKLNLTLHVTGRRADGYHRLDSLVAFANVGDTVRVANADEDSFVVEGPFAASVPKDADNLVLRAARFLNASPLAITLVKRLPVASGIGGGSSDAAAAIRAICALTGTPLPDPAATAVLGADVPVCLGALPARIRGIGERLMSVPPLPDCHVVLVNPGAPVATPDVFRALINPNGTGMPAKLPRWPDARSLAIWLSGQRNDLEPPAQRMVPEIGQALEAIKDTTGCLLARMSGSGATCFGLYSTRANADAAAEDIAEREDTWWVQSCRLGD